MEDRLWYTQPANVFEEALPLGNGSLGAMVFGGVEKELIELNEDTLWSGKPAHYFGEHAQEAYYKARALVLDGKLEEAEHVLEHDFHNMWTHSYLPMGALKITRSKAANAAGDLGSGAAPVSSDATDYIRALQLDTALASAKFKAAGISVRNETFVSYPDDCMVFSEHTDVPMDYALTLSSLLLFNTRTEGDTLVLTGRCPVSNDWGAAACVDLPYDFSDPSGVPFTTAVRVETDGILTTGNVANEKHTSDAAAPETLAALMIHSASHLTVYLTAATGFVNYKELPTKEHHDACLNKLAAAMEKGMNALKAAHVADHSALYDRVSLELYNADDGVAADTSAPAEYTAATDLPTDVRLRSDVKDAGLPLLAFNFGRYLTIAASRPGTQATNLQGIWSDLLHAPWKSNYTVNINTEMNYWPTLACNLTECTEPLTDLLIRIAESGRQTARDFYGLPGFVCHHNTDLWGHTSPVGFFDNKWSVSYSDWNMGSGWLSEHLFRYYEYTLDEGYLRDVAWPIMREAARFYLAIMTQVNGEWVNCPSTSPENRFTKDGANLALSTRTTMSQTIMAELFENCLKAAEVLGIEMNNTNSDMGTVAVDTSDSFIVSEETDDAALLALMRDRLPGLNPLKIGEDGRLLEWDTTYEEPEVTHRHVSHLYGLYPATDMITDAQPELQEACRKSLETRGDAGTGWSLGWKVCLWARLKDGDHALSLIRQQLNFSPAPTASRDNFAETINYTGHGGTFPNMLGAHPPFQIDGNFGVTAGIAEMLVQTENGKLLLLPALPSEWKKGRFSGLRAKGDLSVSAVWDNGIVTDFTITSGHAQEVTVVVNGEEKTIRV